MHTTPSAAKQPVVRFTCPHCRKTLQGQTLTKFLAPSEFAAPATGIKKAVSEIAIALHCRASRLFPRPDWCI